MKLSNLWRKKKPSPYGFFSGYSSWADALKDSTGYTADTVIKATLDRRESFLAAFDPKDAFVDERTQQLLSAVAVILSASRTNSLKVLDFGGGSGLYFHLLRRALPQLEIDWTVIETEELARGHQGLEEPHLRWQGCLPTTSGSSPGPFDLCLASGALPYVPQPYDVLQSLTQLGRFVVVTRTGFIDGPEDKIAVQRIPPEIFTGSYPAWFFSMEKFLAFAQKMGRLRLAWNVPQDTFFFEGKKIVFKGYLLECR
jgi:putative methyltransferase (TIGR04325 family)